MRLTIPYLFLISLFLTTSPVQAVPPYLAIQTAENIHFPKSTCPAAAKKTLTGAGFAKVVRYKRGSSVFAAYRDVTDYQYKAVIKCVERQQLFVVVVVADSPGKAKQKATQLRQKLLNKAQTVPKETTVTAPPAPVPEKTPSAETTTPPEWLAPPPAMVPNVAAEETTGPSNAKSQFRVLGEMYYFGKGGVEQDYVEALRWYQKAAEHGNTEAQHTLGVMYYQGKGAPQDFLMAYQWFSIAAAYGYPAAAQARDNLVSDKLSDAQVVEAQKMARQWFTQHSGQ